MNAWEITTIARSGNEKTVHVVAPDEAHAMIEFRNEYSLDDWRVDSLRLIEEPVVIELP